METCPAEIATTVNDHIRHQVALIAWCPRCLHVERINLRRLVNEGRGEMTLEALVAEFRCANCGGRGQVTQRPC